MGQEVMRTMLAGSRPTSKMRLSLANRPPLAPSSRTTPQLRFETLLLPMLATRRGESRARRSDDAQQPPANLLIYSKQAAQVERQVRWASGGRGSTCEPARLRVGRQSEAGERATNADLGGLRLQNRLLQPAHRVH